MISHAAVQALKGFSAVRKTQQRGQVIGGLLKIRVGGKSAWCALFIPEGGLAWCSSSLTLHFTPLLHFSDAASHSVLIQKKCTMLACRGGKEGGGGRGTKNKQAKYKCMHIVTPYIHTTAFYLLYLGLPFELWLFYLMGVFFGWNIYHVINSDCKAAFEIQKLVINKD